MIRNTSRIFKVQFRAMVPNEYASSDFDYKLDMFFDSLAEKDGINVFSSITREEEDSNAV